MMAKIRKAARPSESADLMRLVQALRAIQVCTGDYPWPLLDLTMAQLKAVMLLVPRGRVRSRELADSLGIAPSAATLLVDGLVKLKLGRRVDDDNDRRIVWIHPTAEAQAVYEDVLAAKEEVLAEVFKELPAAERTNVKQSIRLLAEAADRLLAKRRQPPE
jgi:DNA-binding MarR family transcriptional regulator